MRFSIEPVHNDKMLDAEDIVLHSFTDQQMRELKEFMDYLLSGKFTDHNLDSIWRACGPTWRMSPGSHREIIAHARQCIASALDPSI